MIILFLLALLMIASPAEATFYWAHPSGSASPTCSAIDSTSESIDPGSYGNIPGAIGCMAAGDTLMLKKTGAGTTDYGNGGTTASRIRSLPANSIVRTENAAGRIRVGWIETVFVNNVQIIGRVLSGVNDLLVDPEWEVNGGCCNGAAVTITTGSTNIRLENVDATRGYENGIIMQGSGGGSSNITLVNVNSYNNGNGTHGGGGTGDQEVCLGSVPYSGSPRNGFCHGLYIQRDVSNVTIDGGIWEDNNGYGIHNCSGGFDQANVTVKNITARDNFSTGIGQCFSTGGRVFNNLSYRNGDNGILIGANVAQQVYNNTVYNNTGKGIFYNQGTASSVVEVVNNLVIVNTGGQIDCASCTQTTNISSGIAADHFVNAAADDLTLISTSTARNAGTITFSGTSVPFNESLPDIGRYETSSIVSGHTVDSSNVDVIVGSAFAPFSTISSCTGWTLRENTVTRTLTSCTRQGNATYRLTCSACLSAGTTIDVTHSQTSNIVDSTAQQKLMPWGAAAIANSLSGGGPTFTTKHFRCRVWNKPITGATILDFYTPEDTTCSVANVNGKIAIVAAIDCTGADCIATGFDWEWQTNGGGGWTDVNNSVATNDIGYDATQIGGVIHGASIASSLLTNPHATYVTGWAQSQDSSFNSIDLSQNSTTNILGSFQIRNGLPAGSTQICIRPKRDNGTVISHDVTPCFNVVNVGQQIQ